MAAQYTPKEPEDSDVEVLGNDEGEAVDKRE